MTTCTIGFLVFDDVEEPDFIGPLEVFNTMSDIASRTGNSSFNTTVFMSLSGKDIIGTQGLHIAADCALVDAPELDVLCISGGRGIGREIYNTELLDWLATNAPKCSWIAGLNAGVVLLSAAGLTRNKKLATHWSARHDFTELDFKSPAYTPSNYVCDGNLLTATGVPAGIDMSLWLIGRLHSIPLALATQRAINHQRQPPNITLAQRF